jgi:hypothetical protein
MDQIQQLVNQLQTTGINLTKILTPYAIATAKLMAISDLMNYIAGLSITIILLIIVIICAVLLYKWLCHNEVNVEINEGFVALVMILGAVGGIGSIIGTIVLICNVSNIVVDIYGISHPDIYLAYQVLEKVMQ